MKCLSLVLSTLAISSYVSAQTLNYPLFYWNQQNGGVPVETTATINAFDAISALQTDSKEADLIVILQNGLST
jgi:hypothetical protein